MLNNSKNETIDQTNSYLYRCSLKSVSQTQAAIARQLTVPDRSCLGYVVPQSSAYRLPAFAIAMQHKLLPVFVSMHRWAWEVMSRKAKWVTNQFRRSAQNHASRCKRGTEMIGLTSLSYRHM